jgi:hypothetical protein
MAKTDILCNIEIYIKTKDDRKLLEIEREAKIIF